MSSNCANGVLQAASAVGVASDSEIVNGVSAEEDHYSQVSFLPIVHDIIHIIEKDNQDASQKNRDSLEASQKVAELGKKIESARNYIYKLPGITHSQQVQLQRLQNLHTQLEMKKGLISKYKGLNMKLVDASSNSDNANV